MGYDYLYDLFGKYRKKETRFSEVEKRAINLLIQIATGNIDKDRFAEQMEIIDDEFHKLTLDEEGNGVIDQDTPLWLNLFLGNKFRRWNYIRKVMAKAGEDPEITSSPEWEEALVALEVEEQRLMQAVIYCLDELR